MQSSDLTACKTSERRTQHCSGKVVTEQEQVTASELLTGDFTDQESIGLTGHSLRREVFQEAQRGPYEKLEE